MSQREDLKRPTTCASAACRHDGPELLEDRGDGSCPALLDGLMSRHVLVWDLETVPDLEGYAAANGLVGQSAETICADIGDRFPRPVYPLDRLHWRADRGKGSGRLANFCARRSTCRRATQEGDHQFVCRQDRRVQPQLATFNGSSFDLPVDLLSCADPQNCGTRACRPVTTSTDLAAMRLTFAMCSSPSEQRQS